MLLARLSLSLALVAFAATSALPDQTVQMTGRVLEKASMLPVAGAMVLLKNFSAPVTLTDSLGYFTLFGNRASTKPRQLGWSAPLLDQGMLVVHTLMDNVVVEVEVFDSAGTRLDDSVDRLPTVGVYSLPVLNSVPVHTVAFLKVRAGDEIYRFRISQEKGISFASHAGSIPGKGILARLLNTSGNGDSLEITKRGLVTTSVPAPMNGEVGDILMETPLRKFAGVGAKRPYGALVLFDGSKGPGAAQAELFAKWQDWRDWPNGYAGRNWQTATKNTSPPAFKIAQDPQFPKDTNRVTLRTDSVTGPPGVPWRWGYDDIEVKAEYAHRDVQIHVEWVAMGVYEGSDPENPNRATTYNSNPEEPHYVNSGVYVQNRYEIQIQSEALERTISGNTNCHAMGSVVNEFAPGAPSGGGGGTNCVREGAFASPCMGCATKSPLKGNGQWQSYDITFRSARYKGAKKVEDAYLSVWWNGQLVHRNRRLQGLATGLDNTSGEAIDSAIYGIKLQRERGDVRFRNIWMKHLKIDSANTVFGY